MRRKVEILLGAVLVLGIIPGVVAYQLAGEAPSCADPCVVLGDRYDTGTREWVLYLAHCPGDINTCEPDQRYVVDAATWQAYKPGMRYQGPVNP